MSRQQTFMPEEREKPLNRKKKKGKNTHAIEADLGGWGRTFLAKYDCLKKAEQALPMYESQLYYRNVKIVEI